MNAIARNREIFEATGLTISGLPEQYMNDHPTRIVCDIHKIHDCCVELDNKSVTFDVEFKYPEIQPGKRKAGFPDREGYLTVDIGTHPKNKALVDLIQYLNERDVSICFFGRQFEKQFHVTAFYPQEHPLFSLGAFFYFLSELGLSYQFPPRFSTEGTAKDAENHYALIYKMFRDRYPRVIQNYLDEHMDQREYRDSVRRFTMMDWRTPKLDLPTAEEARKILDDKVFGMDEVKERLLEFLEGIRRSGSLAKNLMLIGPPGTGKTTIMQAVAKMLSLPMSIVPMSACTDLDAFVGFAKTYSGAQEGLVTTALMSPLLEKPDGSREPVNQIAQVLFLNEIDKADSDKNHHGSVQSAILRMADDNRSFFDVYHQAHLDLSNVVIVADANDASKIQDAVLNRFDVIEIPPYSESEKEFIFRNYTFPGILRTKNVLPSEVAVTDDTISRIVSCSQEPGIREQKKIAERIVGNYLLHHSGQENTVYYTPEMVDPFLPKQDVRGTMLAIQPGSIRSIVLAGNKALNIDVQCAIKQADHNSFALFGSDDPLLKQELEAAVICASNYLPMKEYDIKVQLYGLQKGADAVGQLSFPVFMSVLSAANRCIENGLYYGGTTLLGGITCSACNDPDSILSFAERQGIKRIITATGFSERLKHIHKTEVYEVLDAKTAATLFLGKNGIKEAC